MQRFIWDIENGLMSCGGLSGNSKDTVDMRCLPLDLWNMHCSRADSLQMGLLQGRFLSVVTLRESVAGVWTLRQFFDCSVPT